MKYFVMLVFVALQASAQQYTVDFRIENMRWGNHETWKCELIGQVYANGSPVSVQTMSSYNFKWQTNITGSWFSYVAGEDTGLFEYSPDGVYDDVYPTRVVVQGSPFGEIISEVVGLGKTGMPWDVYHSVLRQNGQPVAEPKIEIWTNPDWYTHGSFNFLTVSTEYGDILRINPFVLGDLTEKFQNWVGLNKILTHDEFIITTQVSDIDAQLGTIHDATARSQLIEGGALDSIDFMDPWLVDYVDPSVGDHPRNRGLAAPFKRIASGSNNIGINTLYKGVFLNQGDTLNLQPPYYSIRAPLVQSINGSAAFFVGWSYDPNKVTLKQVGSNPSGYDQKAVIFKQAGATVTAQYTNSSISQNTTIPAGTYQMAGSLTVSSGITLTLSPGATLEFPSGATLVLNGKLIANGTSGQKITFKRRTGSSDWMGFSLTGSGANASSVQHCIISYAKQPLVATNVGSMTISNVTVDSSSFYNNNSSDAAAVRFYNSSPTITTLIVNGQSNSWNGVRFAQGSTGSITSSTIQNLGAGNGIVLQGGSSPLIYGNTIQNNYYHGIISNFNGSGNPIVIGNSVLNNGVVNGVKTYVGIDFYNSTGKFGSNTIQGSNYGIYFDSYASPTTWWTGAWWGFVGNNTVSSNLYGLVAYNYSNPIVGRVSSFHGELLYEGTCNNILNNTTYNAFANVNCNVTAAGNWWGAAPPDPAKIFVGSGSTIALDHYGTPSQPCPGGGGAAMNPIAGADLSIAGSAAIQNSDPVSARLQGDYTSAREVYQAMLEDESLGTPEKSRALVGLYEVLRDSNDPLNIRPLEDFAVDSELGPLATELLMNSQVIIGDYAKARDMALAMSQSEDRGRKNNALLLLASLDSYSPEYSDVSNNAKGELKTSGIDQGMLVALGIEPAGRTEQATLSQESGEGISISNYPNPFNPTTNINFSIPSDGQVTLRVFDMLGRVVESLLNETRPAGTHQVSFDGSRLPSGVYFYRLEFNGLALSRKFVLAK